MSGVSVSLPFPIRSLDGWRAQMFRVEGSPTPGRGPAEFYAALSEPAAGPVLIDLERLARQCRDAAYGASNGIGRPSRATADKDGDVLPLDSRCDTGAAEGGAGCPGTHVNAMRGNALERGIMPKTQ